MLSRSEKLTKEQLEHVIEKGRVFHSPLFTLRVIKTDSSGKLAAIVSKKVAKKAVDRNKARRWIYAAVRAVAAKSLPPYHIALFAKEGIFRTDFSGIIESVKGIFDKADLLK